MSEQVNSGRPDISVVTTFHKEGRLMAATLRSIKAAIDEAERGGLQIEWILVLDAVNQATRDFLAAHAPAGSHSIEVDVRDLGGARNAGIAVALGEFVAIADADDMWSANWLSAAHSFAQSLSKPVVLHPKVVICFEKRQSIRLSIDSDAVGFSLSTLLETNCWSAHSFAPRSLYLEVPFDTGLNLSTGFAFEDWHFNCETLALGVAHKCVLDTFHCYRIKQWKESLTSQIQKDRSLLPPTKLFALPYQKVLTP